MRDWSGWQRGGREGGRGGGPILHHADMLILFSYHASRKNKTKYWLHLQVSYYHSIWGNLRSEEREKRAGSWCHTYLFLMSLLLVSNDINHHRNFKRKSRDRRRENSKSRITLLCTVTPHAANLGPITHHADNLGPITRYGKPLLPWLIFPVMGRGGGDGLRLLRKIVRCDCQY